MSYINENVISEDEATTLHQITDLNEFASAILNWHLNALNQVNHVLNMPEPQEADDTFIETKVRATADYVGTVDENGFRTLDKSEIPAFKAGVQCALDYFATLPVKLLPTDADGNIKPEFKSGIVDEPSN